MKKFAVAILSALTLVLQAAQAAAAETTVEHVTERPKPSDVLGTIEYRPSEKEKSFFEKLPAEEVATGGLAGDYDINGKQGRYVGWFGIVRKIEEDKDKKQTRLTLEHKYFDGLTDAHILALSFNGSGDYLALLQGVGHKIEPLSLVKVYGSVRPNDKDKTGKAPPPTMHAEFVRNWHWGSFTFLMASGEQRGSDDWRKLNRVELDDIYDPYPDDAYYEQRLGKRPKPAQKATPKAGKAKNK